MLMSFMLVLSGLQQVSLLYTFYSKACESHYQKRFHVVMKSRGVGQRHFSQYYAIDEERFIYEVVLYFSFPINHQIHLKYSEIHL